jgi:hypothetical protein
MWAAIPHALRSNPRFISLSDSTFRALIEATIWCSENMTDGILTPGYVGRFMSEADASALRDAGLLQGSKITFFLDVNQTAAKRKELHDRAEAAANARWNRSGASSNAESNASSIPPSTAKERVESKEEKDAEKRDPDSCTVKPSAASASPSLDTVSEKKPPEPEAVKVKPPKPKREMHPRYKPTLDAIDAIYREATGGQKPDWSNPKERAAVDRLARAREVDEIVVRARRFWIDHLPGFVWQGKLTVCSVADFACHFSRLAIVESTNGHYASNGLPDDFVPQRVY